MSRTDFDSHKCSIPLPAVCVPGPGKKSGDIKMIKPSKDKDRH